MHLRQVSNRGHGTQCLVTRNSPFRLTLIKKDRKNGERRKGRVFIEEADL